MRGGVAGCRTRPADQSVPIRPRSSRELSDRNVAKTHDLRGNPARGKARLSVRSSICPLGPSSSTPKTNATPRTFRGNGNEPKRHVGPPRPNVSTSHDKRRFDPNDLASSIRRKTARPMPHARSTPEVARMPLSRFRRLPKIDPSSAARESPDSLSPERDPPT
jgi:hypothetical protein